MKTREKKKTRESGREKDREGIRQWRDMKTREREEH